MKEVGRSVHSIDVVKKKSSSGCLIIKKKVADGVGGVQGFSDSSSRKLYYSAKEKKRPRPIRSDSESSDEFTEPYRQKLDNFHNGSSFSNRGFMGNRESEIEKRVNNGINMHEFDEYNGFHERMNRKDVNDQRHGLKLHWQSGDLKNSASGSSRLIDDKRREFLHDKRNAILGGNSSRPIHGIKSGYKMEDDKSHLPLHYREVSDEPIRLQGKNGVLKVMVKKHKQMSVPHQSYNHHPEVEEWKESRPVVYKKKQPNISHKSHDHWEGPNRKKTAMESSSLHSASRHPEKPVSFKNQVKGEVDLDLERPVLDDSDTSLPIKPSAEKMVKIEKRITPQTKKVTPVKGKESKVKRGSGTEKQLLREKIRSMLLGAGWTIDYRPRRNRDYLDAVYINPTGTAYWSIIKAYEALQKEEQKDHSQVGGEFTPLPVETLSKLTRQTRKKIEREMKKKKRDEGNNNGDADDSNDNYYVETAKQEKAAAKRSVGLGREYDSQIPQGQKSRKLGRCVLLVRSEGKSSENDRFVSYSGKRTILSWLIDSGTVEMSEKVEYMNRRKTRVMQEGWITKDGIHCGCCSKILSVLKFELHAGSKLKQPYLNIFGQSGKSLMQCQIDAWNKQGELERKGFYAVDVDGDDPNDDTCGLCGDGGDLICCDGCPSTFHQSCLGIKMLPQGDWHCPNCSCKYCETEAGVRTESQLLACCLCEKKYHESCSLEMNEKPVDLTDPNLSFCGQKCLEVYSQLQKLLGAKHEVGSGFSWSLIRRSDLPPDASSMELSQRVECNSKLAVALSVIDECFVPVLDRRSGINLIHNVVYNCGSNFNRLSYSGFFTAILERGDEMICAASIRIHGTQLAEMPFIGTRHMYRRQGMCRRLLSAIESVLSSLHIEKLIIPAIAEHMHTWTDVFGFKPLEETHRQEMRSINMLVFPGTDMLQKPLIPEKGSSLHKIRLELELESNIPKADKSESSSPDVKESRQRIAPSDSGSQDASDATLSISSVKVDFRFPVPERKPNVISDSDVQLDGDDTVMQNGEESTENFAISVAIPMKKGVRGGNETTNGIADADSKVEGFALQNGSVTSITKTGGVNSVNPCEVMGKESVSVSMDSDSSKELTDVQDDGIDDAIPIDAISLNVSLEPKPQLSGMESLPSVPNSAANIAELIQFSTGKEK
ncbi:increased DNA methylation 1 [Lactuca sativa]|uniref:PHD-type domain-containing protein n=1 Tax=Lactuca sativa TaxID=4236 RepID=A0A9R1VHV3_LACSA|nr:increased DNA methylation 1 [Lactuca sativa]KAJ0205035.1 hypothetical protein LSAT_V11C500282320 [Lactuca sativa]